MAIQEMLTKLSATRDILDNNRQLLLSLDDDLEIKVEEITMEIRGLLEEKQMIDSDDCKILKLAVAGDFDTGKSTFINSLIQMDILGMSVLPSTAIVTKLSYATECKYYKYLKSDSGTKINIEKSEYDRYSIHQEDSDESEAFADIDYFEVAYPSVLLKQINIYDTPGFSTADKKADDEVSTNCIKMSDLVIWICSAQSGGPKENEWEKITSCNVPVVIVVNWMDSIIPEKRSLIIETVFQTKDKLGLAEKVQSILPYAAMPILENVKKKTAVYDQCQTIANQLWKKINSNDREKKTVTLENGWMFVDGTKTMQLPEPLDMEYYDYLNTFIEYLYNNVLEKENKKRISLDNLKHRAEELIKKCEVLDIRDVIKVVIWEKRKLENDLNNINSDISIDYGRMRKIYIDKKDTLIGKLYLHVEVYLNYHSRDNKITIGNGHKPELQRNSVMLLKEVEKNANELVDEFRKQYNYPDCLSLEEVSQLYVKIVNDQVRQFIEAIPDDLTLTYKTDSVIDFISLLIDNLIPDELYFEYVHLFFKDWKQKEFVKTTENIKSKINALDSILLSFENLGYPKAIDIDQQDRGLLNQFDNVVINRQVPNYVPSHIDRKSVSIKFKEENSHVDNN